MSNFQSPDAFLPLNGSGSTVRAEIGVDLQAAAMLSQGTSAPSSPYPGQPWHDITTNTLKIRNQANSGWITIAQFDETGGICAPVTRQATRTVLTSGTSATYTTPSGAIRLNVRLVGPGGGGSGTGVGPGAGANGSAATTFGSLSAGAGGGSANAVGGVGGAVSGGDINIAGNAGENGQNESTVDSSGGNGGSGPFGGAGRGGVDSGGSAGATNSGAGGGGGSGATGTFISGGGGGSGGYVEKLITGPSATYTYTVGAGGAGGTAGTSGGVAGGSGGGGMIIIDEFYV